jgi:hypothetical protein
VWREDECEGANETTNEVPNADVHGNAQEGLLLLKTRSNKYKLLEAVVVVAGKVDFWSMYNFY